MPTRTGRAIALSVGVVAALVLGVVLGSRRPATGDVAPVLPRGASGDVAAAPAVELAPPRLAPQPEGPGEASGGVRRAAPSSAPAAEVAAAAPDDEPLVTAPLLPPSIHGRVTHRGQPVHGAVVRLVGADGPVDDRVAETDEQGDFELGARPSAAAFPRLGVMAVADDHCPAWAPVPRDGGGRVDLRLGGGAALAGAVLSPLGDPVDGALVAVDDGGLLATWGRPLIAVSRANAHFLATGGLPSSHRLPVVATRRDGEFEIGGFGPHERHRLALVDPRLRLNHGTVWSGEPGRTLATTMIDGVVLLRAPKNGAGEPRRLAVRDVRLTVVDGAGDGAGDGVGDGETWALFEAEVDAVGLTSTLGWLDVVIQSSRLKRTLGDGEERTLVLTFDASLDGGEWSRRRHPLISAAPGHRRSTPGLLDFGTVTFDPSDSLPDGRLRLVVTTSDGGEFRDGVALVARRGAQEEREFPWHLVLSTWEVDLRAGVSVVEVSPASAPEGWPPVITRVAPGFEDRPLHLVVPQPAELRVERPEGTEGPWSYRLYFGGAEGPDGEALRSTTTTAPAVVVPAVPPGRYWIQWWLGGDEPHDGASVELTGGLLVRVKPAAVASPPADG